MTTHTPSNHSQFSGAVAMFRKKEMDLSAASNANALISPKGFHRKVDERRGSSSSFTKKKSKNALSPPSFVSPGRGKPLNKSWEESGTLSPPPFAKKPESNCVTNSWKSSSLPSPRKEFEFDNFEPDIKIQVKSNVQRTINARKQKRSFSSQYNSKQSNLFSSSEDHIPEHIRKVRAREERRLRADEEREHQLASLLQACFLGWYVRTVTHPALQVRWEQRLAILKIQKTFRMYMQYKRYKHLVERKRRRERKLKEIKKIQKKIEKMPKKSKQDIKETMKEYELRKKEMLKKARRRIKEEDEQIAKMKESGKDMIKYLNDENDKVKELIRTIQKEQTVLEKQFEVLTAKSEEIASNFKSLQKWVDTKNESIKKNEAMDQKCRYRYLPKYREDLVLRNKYCETEYSIKQLYKNQLKKIVNEVEKHSKNSSLIHFVQREMKSCRKSLDEMPRI
mmetsp:Transcript_5691/g.14210  ORF Transcript_5691/g.14210 Transcript_5691/m.14210 type:complete len:451 (-) Transcript_5691:148-1500(-)